MGRYQRLPVPLTSTTAKASSTKEAPEFRRYSDPYCKPDPVSSGAAVPRLPQLHWLAYRGDVAGVLQCIEKDADLQEALTLTNTYGKQVCGVTPLFLAAQRGNYQVCTILVDNGANPLQSCYVPGTAELCTPAEVAALNHHAHLARFLKKAAKKREKELQPTLDMLQARNAAAGETPASRLKFMLGWLKSIMQRRPLLDRSASTPAPAAQMLDSCIPEEGEEDMLSITAAAAFMQHYDLNTYDPKEAASSCRKPKLQTSSSLSKVLSQLFSSRASLDVSPSQVLPSKKSKGSRLGSSLYKSKPRFKTADIHDACRYSVDLQLRAIADSKAGQQAQNLAQFFKEVDLDVSAKQVTDAHRPAVVAISATAGYDHGDKPGTAHGARSSFQRHSYNC